jgi:hypothetical protein
MIESFHYRERLLQRLRAADAYLRGEGHGDRPELAEGSIQPAKRAIKPSSNLPVPKKVTARSLQIHFVKRPKKSYNFLYQLEDEVAFLPLRGGEGDCGNLWASIEATR